MITIIIKTESDRAKELVDGVDHYSKVDIGRRRRRGTLNIRIREKKAYTVRSYVYQNVSRMKEVYNI